MNLLAKIEANSYEDADCIRWSRGCCNGHPAMRWEGKSQLVRRLLWTQANGDIPAGKIIRCTCESKDCVSLDHLELSTYKKVAIACGTLGLMSGPVRTAKISAVKQKQCGSITLEIADAIRTSREPGAALSRSMGIPQSKISKIRLNKAWRRPMASPWFGLGATI